MGDVKFLAHYSIDKEKRVVSPAAVTVVNYIIMALNNCGHNVTLISPAQTNQNKDYQRAEFCEKLNKFIFLPSYKKTSNKNLFLRFLNKIRRRKDLDFELLNNVGQDDVLIVYHSLALNKSIIKLKKKRKFKLIMLTNEIYADVTNNARKRKKELAYLQLADGYIFSTKLLEGVVNKSNKPSVVCLGAYDILAEKNKPKKDDKIHIVYAGTFDIVKGSSTNAVKIAEFLDERYHLHIIGFGSAVEIEYLNELIRQTREKSSCIITYDGLKTGDEYYTYLQSCDIGLSTQNPEASFSLTSFPSKILTYLANGLRVVTIRLEVLKNSKLNEFMFYVDENSPKAFAQTIKAIDFNKDYDGRKIIQELDGEFKLKLCELLKSADL